MSESILSLTEVSRVFKEVRAVDRLSLDIAPGEIFTLLGPSGCGKTTTLRLVAGLERPDGGDIRIRDKLVAAVSRNLFVPPHKRNLGMVFQSYAIWPHLTVYENVSYPLRVRGVRRSDARERVARVLSLVGLQGLEDRPGPLLSGGQQQRVALARALVYEPDLLLLDEPFSNLDSKLRDQMRVEVKQLQKRLGITVLFVTHDQTEALSLSSRIAVMQSGHAMQIGTPKELYENPQAAFVRDFLGKSVIMRGQVKMQEKGRACITLNGGEHTIVSDNVLLDEDAPSSEVLVSIRPEDIRVQEDGKGEASNCLPATINTLLFVGDRYECHMSIGADDLTISLPRNSRYREGELVMIQFPESAVSVWPLQ